jgi:hypothetical protein
MAKARLYRGLAIQLLMHVLGVYERMKGIDGIKQYHNFTRGLGGGEREL